jgi:hypothetical protein
MRNGSERATEHRITTLERRIEQLEEHSERREAALARIEARQVEHSEKLDAILKALAKQSAAGTS